MACFVLIPDRESRNDDLSHQLRAALAAVSRQYHYPKYHRHPTSFPSIMESIPRSSKSKERLCPLRGGIKGDKTPAQLFPSLDVPGACCCPSNLLAQHKGALFMGVTESHSKATAVQFTVLIKLGSREEKENEEWEAEREERKDVRWLPWMKVLEQMQAFCEVHQVGWRRSEEEGGDGPLSQERYRGSHCLQATKLMHWGGFPDLPELAHLRHLFTERFRTHMEGYVNEEFVEKMQKNSFPRDKKLQLMQDIAKEFTVNWDVKSFEYKLSNPSAPTSVQLEKRLLSGNENDMKSQNVVREREIDTERIVMDNGRKPVLEENPDPSPGASKLQMQQAKSDLKRSNLLKEDKRNNEKMDMNIAQKHLQPESGAFRRSFNVKGYQLDSTQKFDEVLCDEPDIFELHQFDEQPLRVKIKDNLNEATQKNGFMTATLTMNRVWLL
ncbi:hypothetical protein HPP92_010657 [Vanilla planifolia]|uniref:Uncharacterized protein n=1 Tax=Vanilla planifolia TaxID=51239 RepID=A0A835V2Q5_VANPL|nr:hypothetical protein HPP92_010657 [Vanilla planifolia]